MPMLTDLVLACATAGSASRSASGTDPGSATSCHELLLLSCRSCWALERPYSGRGARRQGAATEVSQPRRRIHSAAARASMRPSPPRIAVALAVLAAVGAQRPADDGDRLAGRHRLEQLGVHAAPAGSASRGPTAAACSSGSPAPPTTTSGAHPRRRPAPRRSRPGARRSGPKSTPSPSWRGRGADVAGRRRSPASAPGRCAAASRASSSVGRYGGSRSSGSAGSASAISPSRRRAASRGRRRGARARAACRAGPGGAGSPRPGRRRGARRPRRRSRRWRSSGGPLKRRSRTTVVDGGGRRHGL